MRLERLPHWQTGVSHTHNRGSRTEWKVAEPIRGDDKTEEIYIICKDENPIEFTSTKYGALLRAYDLAMETARDYARVLCNGDYDLIIDDAGIEGILKAKEFFNLSEEECDVFN